MRWPTSEPLSDSLLRQISIPCSKWKLTFSVLSQQSRAVSAHITYLEGLSASRYNTYRLKYAYTNICIFPYTGTNMDMYVCLWALSFMFCRVGVTSEPEVFTRTLTTRDAFIILASDGVWEFIPSQDAVNIIGNSSSAEEGCRQVRVEGLGDLYDGRHPLDSQCSNSSLKPSDSDINSSASERMPSGIVRNPLTAARPIAVACTETGCAHRRARHACDLTALIGGRCSGMHVRLHQQHEFQSDVAARLQIVPCPQFSCQQSDLHREHALPRVGCKDWKA